MDPLDGPLEFQLKTLMTIDSLWTETSIKKKMNFIILRSLPLLPESIKVNLHCFSGSSLFANGLHERSLYP